jgi:hypothetical protein
MAASDSKPTNCWRIGNKLYVTFCLEPGAKRLVWLFDFTEAPWFEWRLEFFDSDDPRSWVEAPDFAHLGWIVDCEGKWHQYPLGTVNFTLLPPFEKVEDLPSEAEQFSKADRLQIVYAILAKLDLEQCEDPDLVAALQIGGDWALDF